MTKIISRVSYMILAIMIATVMVVFSSCGSSYPVFLGSTYQDVYDYCKENAVDDSFYPDDYSIKACLDWFGDGNDYNMKFLVEKDNDEGVTEIELSYLQPGSIELDMDSTTKETEEYTKNVEEFDGKAKKVLKSLMDEYGEPVGEKKPKLNSIRPDSPVIWNSDDCVVSFDYNFIIANTRSGSFYVKYKPKEKKK